MLHEPFAPKHELVRDLERFSRARGPRGAGFDHHLLKPIDVSQIHRMLAG